MVIPHECPYYILRFVAFTFAASTIVGNEYLIVISLSVVFYGIESDGLRHGSQCNDYPGPIYLLDGL